MFLFTKNNFKKNELLLHGEYKRKISKHYLKISNEKENYRMTAATAGIEPDTL